MGGRDVRHDSFYSLLGIAILLGKKTLYKLFEEQGQD